MTNTNLRESKNQKQTDFSKALKFYQKIDLNFKEDYDKLTSTFPQKYRDSNKQTFMEQFKELDDVQKLLWCDHQLKEAYSQLNKKEGLETARKNILWALMVCKQFKIVLKKQYNLMKMIRQLWSQDLSNSQPVVADKLKQIFEQLGQTQQPAPKQLKKNSVSTQQKKKTTMCGCAGDSCVIF